MDRDEVRITRDEHGVVAQIGHGTFRGEDEADVLRQVREHRRRLERYAREHPETAYTSRDCECPVLTGDQKA